MNTLKIRLRKSALCFFYAGICCAFHLSVITGTGFAEVVDRIVAIVNEDVISLFDLNQMCRPYVKKIKAQGHLFEQERTMLFEIRNNMLNKLIDQKLTDQEVRRSDIKISEKEVDQAIENIKKTNYYTDEDLRGALAGEGFTIEDYRNKLKEQMLRSKLVNFEVKSRIVITQEDTKVYYEDHLDMFGGGTKYHLKNIIMPTYSFTGEEERLEIKKKMEMILARLKQGEPFDTVMRRYSSSLEVDGGDLGLFGLDALSPQIQKAVKGLTVGEFTSVLDTDQGYQIFFVSEVVPTKPKPLEEVSSEIENKLFAEKVKKRFELWLKDLREQSHIKIIQ